MKTMNETHTLADATLGGPGLDGYSYQADVYCITCGEAICAQLAADRSGAPWDDDEFRDSEILPQPIFFGESDQAEHCADCGEHLYGADPDADPIEPEEGDYILAPAGQLGARTAVYECNGARHSRHGELGDYPDEDTALEVVRNRMAAESYYPNVWRQDDHGGYVLLTVED